MRIIIFLITLFFNGLVFSQLSTSGNLTPAQLVQDVLLGQGVTVSNITYTGANGAIGRFNGVNSSIGLDDGIIITTGTINSGPNGPYGPNDKPNAGIDNNAGGYGPLTNIVNTQTYNAAVLEFDFVPQSDTVRFEYVFGSEEYPEWVGDQFNDVFAFFISGPGIAGNQNMALIPGTTLPVAINNVNNGSTNNGPCNNCNYYVNNGTGNNAPFNNNPFYVQYDGFTTPLKAVSPVQCGETYHLIIAIADVGDAIFDSGIFLSANSLSSEQPINMSYQLSSNPYGDGQTLAQGCTSATVTVTRSGSGLDQPLAVPISLSGSAIEGVDFSNVPNVVNFNANQTSVSFTFDALNNPNLIGTANLIIELEIQDPCGEDNFQSIEVFFNPVEPVEVVLTTDDVLCPGEEVELFAIATGGGGGYTYQWSTGETTSSIMVNPTTTQTYTVSVTDDCLNETVTVEGEVNVPVYDPLIIEVTDDIVEQCPFVPFDLEVEAEGGAGNYFYEWTDEMGNIISNMDIINVVPSQTSTYFISVEDQCGELAEDEVTITILSPPLVLNMSPDVEICPGDSTTINVQAFGGFGDYYYLWPNTGDTVNQITVAPEVSEYFKVIVSDDCQTFDVRDSVLVEVVKPTADFQVLTTPMFNNLPIFFQNLTLNGVSYQWRFGDGNFSEVIHPNNTYEEPGDYEITLIAEDDKGCLDTIQRVITIQLENFIYVPNAFTPDGDRFNNDFRISTVNIEEFHIIIFNRWGEVVFEAYDPNFRWDGTYGGVRVKDGTYPWVINYKAEQSDEEVELKGHITVIR